MDNYKNFKVEDFVCDPFFREWVLNPNHENGQKWNQWLNDHPDHLAYVHSAREVVLSLRVNEESISDAEIREVVNRTISKIKQSEALNAKNEAFNRRFYQTNLFRIAASIVLLLGIGFVFLKLESPSKAPELASVSKPEIASDTHIGWEVVTNSKSRPMLIKLSDASKVTLAPGSRLTYPANFNNEKNRQVHLTGEAFFDITKDPSKPFLVFAEDIVTKVLGTSFTVKAYPSSKLLTVEVKTGKVAVFSKQDPQLDSKINNTDLAGIVLVPNQKAILERGAAKMVKTLVEKPEIVLPKSEIPHFNFEDTPASEAFAIIGKAYGIKIIYDEDILKDCPVTAPLDNQTLNEKLSFICKAVEASYEVVEGQIIIHSSGCKN